MDWYLYLFQASTVDEPDAICFTERYRAEIDAIQRGESLFHDITSNFTAYRIWRVTALGDVERVTDWRFRPKGLVRDENVVYATQIARRAADRLESLTRDMDILRSEIAVYKSQIESLKASQSATQELPTVNAFRSLLDELSRVRAYCREELAVCQKEISKIRDKVEAQGNKGLGK